MTKIAQQDLLKLAPPHRYRLQAYSTSVKFNIKLKRIEETLGKDGERYSQHCVIYHIGEAKKVFIFSFGTVVFFNVPADEHESILSKLGHQNPPRIRDIDSDDFTEDNLLLDIRQNVTKVNFNAVTMPDLDITRLQLVAQVLAQSSALEWIEWEVDEFLMESERMTGFLKKQGFVKRTRAKLLKFLGEGLSAKHKIVNQLALFNDPEKTWEKEELYHLYLGLIDNFDIKERSEAIEKKLNLCSEVTELLLELLHARRSEILELTIIALILFEIVSAFVKF